MRPFKIIIHFWPDVLKSKPKKKIKKLNLWGLLFSYSKNGSPKFSSLFCVLKFQPILPSSQELNLPWFTTFWEMPLLVFGIQLFYLLGVFLTTDFLTHYKTNKFFSLYLNDKVKYTLGRPVDHTKLEGAINVL